MPLSGNGMARAIYRKTLRGGGKEVAGLQVVWLVAEGGELRGHALAGTIGVIP